MAKYDPQDFESVMSYMRYEYGASVFREPGRMYALLCDLSPDLKPYARVMRQLAELGALAELEAASGDDTRQARAIMKARHLLANELLLGADRVDYFLGVLRTLYGIAPPASAPQAPTPPQAAPQPPPMPQVTQPPPHVAPQPPPHVAPQPIAPAAPPPAKIVKRGECGDKGGNVTFTLDENGVLVISGNGRMRDFKWNEKSKTRDTPWWDERETISLVKIGNGVTAIGLGAFGGCSKLASVRIPDSVISIGVNAFVGCVGLKSVVIPDSVTHIDAGAFADCARLTSIVIPDSVIYIDTGAFIRCAKLNSVVIPDSVTYIEDYAFDGCKNLKSVSVPTKAKIRKSAFPSWVRVERRA